MIKRPLCLLSAVFIVTTFRLASASALIYPTRGIINTKDVRLRESAGTRSASLAKLKLDTLLEITGEDTDTAGALWYAVITPKGAKGYVMAEYVSAEDRERMDEARASASAAVMLVRVSAHCGAYHGLGKTWTRFHEINGRKLENGPTPIVLAPDVPFTLYTRQKSKTKASGEDSETLSPSAEDLAGGFTVSREITASTAKKEAVWEITFTFTPVGAVPAP